MQILSRVIHSISLGIIKLYNDDEAMFSTFDQLFFHNVIVAVSVVVLLAVFIFLIVKGRKNESSLIVSFAVLFVAVFFMSHLIGINITNPDLSRRVLMLNILMIFIGTYNLHAIYAMFGKAEEKKKIIIGAHMAGLVLVVFFFLFPDLFLLESVPKLYFPNYYNPGTLNIIRLIFLFGIILPLSLYELIRIYRQESNIYTKKQVKYFVLTMISGYMIGFFPNFLVYDISVDPLWGAPTAIIFSIPFIYGIIQYNLFNILVIAKKAVYYTLLVGLISLFISLLGNLTNFIRSVYPSFPIWLVYLTYSILVFIVSSLVWRSLKEGDQLKYEFITTITHKFRTPLTGIRWATENLKSMNLSKEAKVQLDYIGKENVNLIELTDVLVGISNMENSPYSYNMKKGELVSLIDDVVLSLKLELKNHNQTIYRSGQNQVYCMFDEEKIKFVIQTIIENAIHYGPTGSIITVSVNVKDSNCIVVVEDKGIGIAKEELAKIFSKFYRGEKAVKSDTEGLGIGLYLAKEMLLRQKGKIWAESEGEGKGSKFSFSLPIAR